LKDLEATASDWVKWFNEGTFGDPGRFYSPTGEYQRLGAQYPVIGPDNIAAFLHQERAAYPAVELRVVETVREGGAIAIEGWVDGVQNEDVTTPFLRNGDVLVFLTIQDGRIIQDHTYVTGSTQRTVPVGLDKVRYVASAGPLPPLLALWEDTFNNDPVRMMRECYTEDATVQAMVPGAPLYDVEQQIAREERSHHIFPGRTIGMKRWVTSEKAIAVEFDWSGVHYKDASRSLHTIAACFLRLRHGLISVDHTYKPTGAA
jgi:hypothetical protein